MLGNLIDCLTFFNINFSHEQHFTEQKDEASVETSEL